MSDGFTIGAASYASTLFQCPNCNETIDNTARTCRFCGQTVDHEAAVKAAELLSKINQACSDASYMKSCALALPVFIVLRYAPIVGMVGAIGFIGLSIGIPIWALRWWIKFGAIKTGEADFLRARKTVKIAGISVFLVLVLVVLASFMLGALLALKRQ
jgi:hypothetical protein